jgi:hypothetical protein
MKRNTTFRFAIWLIDLFARSGKPMAPAKERITNPKAWTLSQSRPQAVGFCSTVVLARIAGGRDPGSRPEMEAAPAGAGAADGLVTL